MDNQTHEDRVRGLCQSVLRITGTLLTSEQAPGDALARLDLLETRAIARELLAESHDVEDLASRYDLVRQERFGPLIRRRLRRP